MTAYYNEIDPNAAEWLRQLIKMGAIAPGDVDERSIEDVTPDELTPYTQCHFFAGIGGWSLALRLAEWPDDHPVWTGSCPCQPFSQAGKGKGIADERHLWPSFFWLISQCRPETVFGEQVASKDGLGWWDIVSADLEGTGYACGAVDLCAAGVGAFHLRQRIYWVANSPNVRQRQRQHSRDLVCEAGAKSWNVEEQYTYGFVGSVPDDITLAHANGRNPRPEWQQCSRQHRQQPQDSGAAGGGDCGARVEANPDHQPSGDGEDGSRLAHPQHNGHDRPKAHAPQQGRDGATDGLPIGGDRELRSPWDSPIWLPCADGKARPTERSIQPLVNGLPSGVGYSGDISTQTAQNTAEGRVMRLKGYGNAIVPQLAAEFIQAYLE